MRTVEEILHGLDCGPLNELEEVALEAATLIRHLLKHKDKELMLEVISQLDGSNNPGIPGGEYWQAISSMNARQEAKGKNKYGQPLEDNNTLTFIQRIEHLQEELIDGLKYAEHLKRLNKDGITLNDYQRAAMRTASGMIYGEGKTNSMLMNAALGLSGESGEVADIIKKHTFQGHDLDKDHVAEELGDVLWYVAIGAEALGLTLGEIGQRNIEKLKARYPEGFDKSRSIHREAENAEEEKGQPQITTGHTSGYPQSETGGHQ